MPDFRELPWDERPWVAAVLDDGRTVEGTLVAWHRMGPDGAWHGYVNAGRAGGWHVPADRIRRQDDDGAAAPAP